MLEMPAPRGAEMTTESDAADDHAAPEHDHDRGLSHDLPTLLSRRRMLTLFGGASMAAALAACSSGSDSPSTDGASTSADSASPSATGDTIATGKKIPAETGGPFPGDGSNGVNVLTESGIVRSDLTTSFGSASGVAKGVPLTIKLKVLDVANGSAALAGAAVYIWHCDKDGGYSLYSDGVAEENYLRGVQETDSDGLVTFTSIYPGAYSGRWPHIHFEVYPSLDDATSASSKLRTSQLALPKKASSLVYATDGYEASVANLARTSLDTDNVFSDGYSLQLATITGTVDDGMVATLNVPV
jgi:protocatechuate 3,4-dioxygenase beta subunit